MEMYALLRGGGRGTRKEALKLPSIQGNLDREPLHVWSRAVNVTNGNQISLGAQIPVIIQPLD